MNVTLAKWEPSPAQHRQKFADRIRALHQRTVSELPVNRASALPIDLSERLFDSQARSARLVSLLSMHLSDTWRQVVLAEFSRLLSLEDWDDDSNLLDEASTRTFLRFVIYGGVQRLPMLGISNRRRLTSSWHWGGTRKLDMEFGPADACRMVFSYPGEFALVRQAMDGNIGDAVGVLKSHGFDFSREGE